MWRPRCGRRQPLPGGALPEKIAGPDDTGGGQTGKRRRRPARALPCPLRGLRRRPPARLHIAVALRDNVRPGRASRPHPRLPAREPGAPMLRHWMPGTASWPSVRVLAPCRRAEKQEGNKPKSWLFSKSLGPNSKCIRENLLVFLWGYPVVIRISPKNSTSFHLRIGPPHWGVFERRACG